MHSIDSDIKGGDFHMQCKKLRLKFCVVMQYL